jgi:hypothetical protein
MFKCISVSDMKNAEPKRQGNGDIKFITGRSIDSVKMQTGW